MGIIQSLDVKKFSNFGDLAIFYLKHLTMLFQSAETIVDVFDRYDLKDSIQIILVSASSWILNKSTQSVT
jgi:GTPase SAR1 family protein